MKQLKNKLVVIKGYEAYRTGVSYCVVNIEIYNKQFKMVGDIYVTLENSIGVEQAAIQALAKHYKKDYYEVKDILRTTCLVKELTKEIGYKQLKAMNKHFETMDIVY